VQGEIIATILWGVATTCQYHGDKSVWLVKQPLNSINSKTQVKKSCLCRNMANNSTKHIVA